MNKHSLLAAGFAALLLATGAAHADKPPLEPLAFLAGNCWTTALEKSHQTDTHCYEWMNGGKQIRDRHAVTGNKPEYTGETVYAFNGERKRVEYRYWNSEGGQSDGYLEVAPDGTLRFLDDRYVGADGTVYTFSSEITRPADGRYRILTRVKKEDTWREMWTREFTREETKPAAP